MFILKPYDIVCDPVHRYIEITETERTIIDTWPLQRLRSIKQLPGTAFVYPGATHTRFSHCLGAMHIAGELCEHLMREQWRQAGAEDRKKIEKLIEKVRLAGLFHDIGHGPFSHVFEFQFLDKDQREKYNHERMAEKIIDSELKPILLNPDKMKIELTETDVEDIKNWALKECPPDEKEFFPYQIVADRVNKVDADKFDYLLRDSHYTGTVEYGVIDIKRLILNSEILPEEDKLKVCFHERVKFSLLDLWLARYSMFHAVYFHRTARGAELMLALLLKYLNEILGISKILEDAKAYLTLTDEILDFARRLPPDSAAKKISDRIDRRDFFKPVLDITIPERDTFKCKSLLEFQESYEAEIAKYASLESSQVALDVPNVDSPFYPTPLGVGITFYDDDKNLKHIPLEDISILQASGRYELKVRAYAVSKENRDAIEKAAEKWAEKWDLKFKRIGAFEELSI